MDLPESESSRVQNLMQRGRLWIHATSKAPDPDEVATLEERLESQETPFLLRRVGGTRREARCCFTGTGTSTSLPASPFRGSPNLSQNRSANCSPTETPRPLPSKSGGYPTSALGLRARLRESLGFWVCRFEALLGCVDLEACWTQVECPR